MILKVSRAQAVRRRQRHVTLGGADTFVSTYTGTNLSLKVPPFEIHATHQGLELVQLQQPLDHGLG